MRLIRLKKHDEIIIGDDVRIIVSAVSSGNLHIAMDAPRGVPVVHKKAKDSYKARHEGD